MLFVVFPQAPAGGDTPVATGVSPWAKASAQTNQAPAGGGRRGTTPAAAASRGELSPGHPVLPWNHRNARFMLRICHGNSATPPRPHHLTNRQTSCTILSKRWVPIPPQRKERNMLLTHPPLARSLSFRHAPFSVLAPEGAKPRPFPATWAFSHPPVLPPISFSINIFHHKSASPKGPERPSFSLPRIFYTNPAAFPTLRPGCSSMSAASSPRRPTRRRGSSERRELSLRAGKAEAWLQHSIPEHGLRERDTTTSLTVVQGMKEKMEARGWRMDWERLRGDLDELHEFTVRNPGKPFLIRSQTPGDVGEAIQAVGVALGTDRPAARRGKRLSVHPLKTKAKCSAKTKMRNHNLHNSKELQKRTVEDPSETETSLAAARPLLTEKRGQFFSPKARGRV